MTDTIIIPVLVGVAIVVIAGAIIAAAKHISNSEKHPCKKDIVFSDVCEPKMKAHEDCIEREERERREAFNLLRDSMNKGFEEVKELIRNNK